VLRGGLVTDFDSSAPTSIIDAAICLARWLPPPSGLHHAMYKVENSLKEAQLFFDWWDG